MAKKEAAADVDDLLSSKAKAKKAPAKTAAEPAKGRTKAAASNGKDPLGDGKTKAKAAPAKKAAKGKAAAPKTRAPRSDSQKAEIIAALLKLKKPKEYGDFAEENSFDIRAVRRTARALRDEGKLKFIKVSNKIALQVA